jgi:hypothetical protein
MGNERSGQQLAITVNKIGPLGGRCDGGARRRGGLNNRPEQTNLDRTET